MPEAQQGLATDGNLGLLVDPFPTNHTGITTLGVREVQEAAAAYVASRWALRSEPVVGALHDADRVANRLHAILDKGLVQRLIVKPEMEGNLLSMLSIPIRGPGVLLDVEPRQRKITHWNPTEVFLNQH